MTLISREAGMLSTGPAGVGRSTRRLRAPRSHGEEPLLAVTMTVSAAERFLKALSYAASIVHLRAEELADSEGTSKRVQTAREHGDWLVWAYGRLAYQVSEAIESELS